MYRIAIMQRSESSLQAAVFNTWQAKACILSSDTLIW